MSRVRLETRDGEFVADVEIPPFQTMPEGLIWGERFFRTWLAPKEQGGAWTYREGLLFHVPDMPGSS